MQRFPSAIVIAIVCLACVASSVLAFSTVQRHSAKLHRTPHKHIPDAHLLAPAHRMALDANVHQGNAIYMSGGYLTLGAYFMNITIGSPPQTMSVLVDTGSSNTAVPVRACTRCGTIGPFYEPSKSSTSINMGCSSDACQKCVPEGYNTTDCVFGPAYCAANGYCGYGITYGGGSSALSGSYVVDNVCLSPTLCGTAPIGLILDQFYFTTNFASSEFLGILGLAYPFNACNPSCTDPVLQAIGKQVEFQNVFGMCLTATSGGYLDLGYIDSDRYTGDIQWAPVIDPKWYNIGLMDIQIGSHSLGIPEFMFITTNDVIGAFVDSGTSIILICPACFTSFTTVFQQYYGSLPGINGTNSFFASQCVAKSLIDPIIGKYPNLNFVVQGFNGKTITLTTPPSAYLMDNGSGQYCLGVQGALSVGTVLGDVFMTNYYTIFDQSNNRLGFATPNC